MTKQIPLPIAIAPHARYETYVAGANAAAVAHLAAGDATEVVWLWGERGVGKTHLLQAACAAEPRRAMYLPLGVPGGLDPAVLEGLGGLAVIAIDDVDAIAATPAWNRALLELYNRHQDAGGRLVLAASRPPRDVDFELPDLASRLRGSLVVSNRATRRQAVCCARFACRPKRAGSSSRMLPGAICLRACGAIWADCRPGLERLDSAALASQRKLTIPLIREALSQRP